MKRFLAFLLAFAMMLSLAACGSSSSSSSSGSTAAEPETDVDTGSAVWYSEINMYDGDEAIEDLVIYQVATSEVETWNYLYSQSAADFYCLTNLVDGLLTHNNKGELGANLATEWYTEDNGVTWTFILREDACWVDYQGNYKAALTAQDFLTGLEWVLNAAKNSASNTSMPIALIEGAGEYYELTASMDEEEALALTADSEEFLSLVGIEAVDDYTLVYTCLYECTYFDTVATYNCLYPASQAMIDEIGVDGFQAATYDTLWCCGPYTVTYFESGNEKVYEPNHYWWGNDEYTRFASVTEKMVDSNDTAYTLYQSGDVDSVTLTESTLTTIYSNTDSQYYDYLCETLRTKYSYQIHFAFNKYNEDGTPDVEWNTAIANTAFRLSWYYGLDLTTYWSRTNSINPLSCENNFYSMSGLVYTSDGTEYTDLVKEKLGLADSDGETAARLDADLYEQYKAQAIEELTALGISFPIEVDYYISASSQTALDTANVLKDAFSACFGDDYVVLNICTYVSSLASEVRDPHLASIYINGWGADYGDPDNFLGQETFGDDNAYYSVYYSCINDFYGEDAETPYSDELIEIYETFTAMVKAANEITDDLDARYDAYAEAEAYMLSNALVLPCSYSVSWILTHVNEYSKIHTVYGSQERRFLNWETKASGYTTEDYEAFAAEYYS